MDLKSAYGLVRIEKKDVELYFRVKHNHYEKIIKSQNGFSINDIYIIIKKFAKEKKLKIIAMGIISKEFDEKFEEHLWLDSDIVPYYFSLKEFDNLEEDFDKIVDIIIKDFKENHSNTGRATKSGKVKVHDFLVSLNAIKKITSKKDFNTLLNLSKEFENKKIKMAFFNSTINGGGVALMRHSLIRYAKLLNLDISWYVVNGDLRVFEITKQKIHNVLHGIYHDKYRLTNDDKKRYSDWSKLNAIFFRKIFEKFDVIVVDDPQPSGLIKYIKKINKNVKILYRSHTQIDTHFVNNKKTVQYNTWNYIYKNIKYADLFISHPIKSFVPKNVDKSKVVFMPPTTDPLDGLNKEMSSISMNYYIKLFNDILKSTKQKPLKFNQKYFVQVARFDPAKGIFDLIEAYRIFRENAIKKKLKEIPNLVICGNGAYDDPEGMMIYNKVLMTLRGEKYFNIYDNVKVVMVPFRDQFLNIILRKSFVVLQLSLREGYEVKVTEGLMKGKPVIIYDNGGLPLQVKNNINGFIIKSGDVNSVAEKMYEFCKNENLYEKMSKLAENEYDKNILTIKNLINWLYLAIKVYDNKDFKSDFKDINYLLKEDNY